MVHYKSQEKSKVLIISENRIDVLDIDTYSIEKNLHKNKPENNENNSNENENDL